MWVVSLPHLISLESCIFSQRLANANNCRPGSLWWGIRRTSMWLDSLQNFRYFGTSRYDRKVGHENWEQSRLEDIVSGQVKRTTRVAATRTSLKTFHEKSIFSNRVYLFWYGSLPSLQNNLKWSNSVLRRRERQPLLWRLSFSVQN